MIASAGCSLPLKHARKRWCVEEGGNAVPAELRPGSDRGTERAGDPNTEEPDTLGEGSLVSNSWPFRTLCSERSGKDLKVMTGTWWAPHQTETSHAGALPADRKSVV